MDSLFVDSTALLAIQDTLMVAQTAVATACDSVAQVVAAPITQDSIARLLHTIVENTAPDPTPRLGIQMYQWNFWVPIIALIAGLIGTYYGWKGYFFSKKTAENVARLSPDAQYALCRNFAVQLYKNLVRIMVLKYKVKHEKDITQDEIIALHLPKFEDVFFIDAFYKDADAFMILQKVKTDFQTYAELVRHFSINHTEENVRKLLTLVSELLTQTKEIALYIRQFDNIKENAWTVKEAIAHAWLDYEHTLRVPTNLNFKEYLIFMCRKLNIAVSLFWVGLFILYFILYVEYFFIIPEWLKVFRIDLLLMGAVTASLSIVMPPITLYVLFRKNNNNIYTFTLKHPTLFSITRCFLWIILYYIMYFVPALLVELGNRLIGSTILLCFCFYIIYSLIKIIRVGKETTKTTLQQLLQKPSNSMLDLYLMIMMQYHSKHVLDNKDSLTQQTKAYGEKYLAFTQESEFIPIFTLTQSIPHTIAFPNPLEEKYDLPRYQLADQDVEEFKHWAESVSLPEKYRHILKKATWTTDDMETLWAYMMSIDAALETNIK